MPLLISILSGLAAAGIAWYCGIIGRQITYVTLADGRRQERQLPVLFRLLMPLAPNLHGLFKKPFFNKRRSNIQKKIVSAGYEDLINADEIMSLQILMPLILGLLWVIIISALVLGGRNPVFENLKIPLYVFGPLWLFLYPLLWLKQSVASRKKQIRRSLPFVLDLLTLSVESGMDFMTALQRSVERGKVDAFGEELLRVIREIQVGKTRRQALRDMSARVDLYDLKSVVGALVQADELGVSIGAILRIQSDQIRQRRFDRAEKLANEAPVKMLAPLLLFIFPAVFVILLGPVIHQILLKGF
ncbi:MAG: type II secretion system F family protein [Verrucomicrobiota bacterium]